jgi:glycosyltransferase involved in cell wall biosynthesis
MTQQRKMNSKVTAVFIAYNAAKTLENFYLNFPKNLVNEIILVDDASKDGTFELSKKLGIISYKNPVNLGYGGNMKRALSLALDRGADIIIDIHPDGEYDPSAIPSGIRAVGEGSELVLGNRFYDVRKLLNSGMYIWKLIPIIFLNKLNRIFFGQKIDDFHQGFRIYTRSLLNQLDLSGTSNGYIFSFEIIALAIFHRHKISQVNVDTHYTGSKRGASLKHSIVYSLSIFKVLFLYAFSKLFYKVSIFK